MTPSEILLKHEDKNEHHFHDVDRKWIIEAMEEYAQQELTKERERTGKLVEALKIGMDSLSYSHPGQRSIIIMFKQTLNEYNGK